MEQASKCLIVRLINVHSAADPDRCHRCIGTGQIVPKLNFNSMYKMICSTQLTIYLSRFCPIKASNVTICIICYKTKVNNADSLLKMPNEQFTHQYADAFRKPPFCCFATFDRQVCLDKMICRHFDKEHFRHCKRHSNLGPRVFSDKAADEDPGKIHFIAPKFWGKNRMRSEAQRMLLIKNNAGAYYFSNKLQIACL